MLGVNMLGLREGRAWITRLGVLPTTRRHGVGQILMESLMQKATDLSINF
jgi:ribosomal protein S18 acetylase RimI-like enzyme